MLDTAKVKLILGLRTGIHDDQIDLFIPYAQDDFKHITRQSIDFTSVSTYDITLSQMIAFKIWNIDKLGAANESLVDYSYSKATIGSTGYPQEIEADIIKHRRLY